MYQYLDIMYHTENAGASSVYSTLFDQKTGRRMLLSPEAADGDHFSVPVQDIIAAPDTFLAPCGQKFVISGGQVIDPCAQQTVESLPEPEPAELPPPPDLEAMNLNARAWELEERLAEEGHTGEALKEAGIGPKTSGRPRTVASKGRKGQL